MEKNLRIGITDCGKYENYRRWVEGVPGVEAVKLSMHLQNAAEVEKCQGVLFSGGEDVHPEMYGKPEYVEEFSLQEIIPQRDRYEFEVLEKALAGRKPVLGICRGLQIINVFLGGTLVPDIPRLNLSTNHGKINGVDQIHEIQVDPGSLLFQICGQRQGLVNSAHHQSADRPAESLEVTAYSDTGITEAMEWKNPEDKSWLLLVQWHPERMLDLSSPFSVLVKDAFLESPNPNLLSRNDFFP